MEKLPLPRLAALIAASSKGYYATEAAAQLLIGHETWLHRDDFLAACVTSWDADGEHLGAPLWHPADRVGPDDVAAAAVHWHDIPAFVETAPCSGSEGRILRLVAELAGYDTGIPLDELLSSLDDRNSRLVLDAIAHTLQIPSRRRGVDQ